MSQKPTITTSEQVETAIKLDGTPIGSTIGRFYGICRERIFPGETKKQAKERWLREAEIERWRDNDKRLVGNQIRAVRYDD